MTKINYFFYLSLILIAGGVPQTANSELWEGFPQPTQDSWFYENGSPDPAKVELGKVLFFDKILSGNKNISCATCHHPFTGTSDGLSLPVGEGGSGVSVARNTGEGKHTIHERVPRNSPAIFNLGAKEYKVMFHDGRVATDPSQPSGFLSPAGSNLPQGLDNPLAAQAMFPVTSATEMAGQKGENPVANAAAQNNLGGPNGVWALLAQRLQSNPAYVEMFKAAYPEITSVGQLTYVHAANAIAAFQAKAWRSDNSPFDEYLRGDTEAMSMRAYRGMELFYKNGLCSNCHSGTFQTDHSFHSIAMPQIGPGKGDGIDGLEDFGRERVTKNPADRFKFRTPSLRNVALTGPWGHSGAYNTLEGVIRQHIDPAHSIHHYDGNQTVLPSRNIETTTDFDVQIDYHKREQILSSATPLNVSLSDEEIKSLVSFLHALTDNLSIDIRKDVPQRVPSRLSVFD